MATENAITKQWHYYFDHFLSSIASRNLRLHVGGQVYESTFSNQKYTVFWFLEKICHWCARCTCQPQYSSAKTSQCTVEKRLVGHCASFSTFFCGFIGNLQSSKFFLSLFKTSLFYSWVFTICVCVSVNMSNLVPLSVISDNIRSDLESDCLNIRVCDVVVCVFIPSNVSHLTGNAWMTPGFVFLSCTC